MFQKRLELFSGIRYLTLIDATSGFHNLKLHEKSSYLKTFFCPFGRYRYIRLPFGAALGGCMFHKLDEIFTGLPNVFSIADNTLLAGFGEQGKDHNETLQKVLQV